MSKEDVTARIVLAKNGEQLCVSAFVSGLDARVLTWRMSVAARTSGGTTNTLQSGTVATVTTQPVVTLYVNGDAHGEVHLDVFENGSQVASQSLSLQESAPLSNGDS